MFPNQPSNLHALTSQHNWIELASHSSGIQELCLHGQMVCGTFLIGLKIKKPFLAICRFY